MPAIAIARRAALAVVLAALAALPALAQEGSVGIVEKKVFAMPAYTTVGNQTIREVKVGWESYGQLNAARDNVVVVPHFFTANSHAAGKYKTDDAAPGYWDAIIGPGKPIDTSRFYVVSVDSLVNLNVKDPNTTTTGPATINPETGKPWAMSFPIVTMRDFVNVQKALLDSLGVTRVHAAVGASMGALQSLEWAAAYPDFVQRVVPVIGGAEADAWVIEKAELWGQAITLDPNWNGGDYYDRGGILPTLTRQRIDTLKLYGIEQQLAADFPDAAAREAEIVRQAEAWARVFDANSLVVLRRASNRFDVTGRLDRIRARILYVLSRTDRIFPPRFAAEFMPMFKRAGLDAEYIELDTELGHSCGPVEAPQWEAALRRFMAGLGG